MVDRAKILELVKSKGPILPAQVRKEIGGDTITIGAVLSQLASDGNIKISKIKVGGSPVYYVQEQREKLQEYKDQLNDKQRKAMAMLKEKKVLRDSEQEPVIRASLRDIKDFAKALEVKTKEGSEIFWKWYLASGEEAKKLIKKQINVPQPKAASKGSSEKTTKNNSAGKALKDDSGDKETNKNDTSADEGSSDPQKTLKEENDSDENEKEETENKETELEETDDDFVNQIRDFFNDNDIEIVEEDIIRKGSEADYVVEVPSPIGEQKYYCKAKGKKKCNDGDLSTAYIQGQTKRLPVLFLMTGDMTNKAEDMLEDEFKGMVIKRI